MKTSWTFKQAESDPDGTFRPTHLMERVSMYVEAHVPEETPSFTAVAEAVTGKAQFVRQALEHLITEGYIEETPGPRGARLVRSVRPYREADE